MAEHLYPFNAAAGAVMRPHGTLNAQNTVRVYRSSPERVTLQIRLEKSYATVDLPFDVAKVVAAALVAESD